MSPKSNTQRQGHGDFRHAKEERISIFILKEPIGAGYFAEVWQALDTSMNRQVALKIFYDDIIAQSDVAKAILKEAETQARIQSDRVTPIYACHLDHDSGPGPYYIAMRLMSGGTLDDLLEREHRLPVPKALSIVRDVVEGLKAAHEADIVHRDLKPNNVLFDSHGRAALADFGIAKDLRVQGRGKSIFGRPGTGTPHYMCPEQHLGTEVTKAWDIYGVGVLLYEMLSGNTPFDGSSDVAMYRAKTEKPVPPLRSVVPDIPPRLELVIQRCLDPDVGSRYPDCYALERALYWAVEKPDPTQTGRQPAPLEDSGEELVRPLAPIPTPSVPKATRSVKERIGDFELLALLGLGAGSEVWRAQEISKRRKVALKVFHGDAGGDRRRDACRQALQNHAAVNSDGVVPVYEIHLDGYPPYYAASKLMSGGSLSTLLRSKTRLLPVEALTILRQVIKGLYAAHSVGLIHGGITTDNILIESGGIAALSDFGMRQTLHNGTLPNAGGAIAYMSPEELSGQAPSVSSDIYSLGVVLYEMLVGHGPFQGTTIYEIRQAKLAPPSFTEVSGIPERLQKVIGCCLIDNLEHRYSDCGALTRALDWATRPSQPPPLLPPVATPQPPPPPSVQRPPISLVWIALACLVIVIFVAIVVSQGHH